MPAEEVEREAVAGKFQFVTRSVRNKVISEIRHLTRKAATLEIPDWETALDRKEREAAWKLLPGINTFSRSDAVHIVQSVLSPELFQPWFDKLLDLGMVVPIGRDQD